MIEIDDPFDYLNSLTAKGLKKRKRADTLVEETVPEDKVDVENDYRRSRN